MSHDSCDSIQTHQDLTFVIEIGRKLKAPQVLNRPSSANSTVVTLKWTHRARGQTDAGETKQQQTSTRVYGVSAKAPKSTQEKGQLLQRFWGKSTATCRMNLTLLLTDYKTEPQMDQRPTFKTWNSEDGIVHVFMNTSAKHEKQVKTWQRSSNQKAAKKLIGRMKRQAIESREYLPTIHLAKELLSRVHKGWHVSSLKVDNSPWQGLHKRNANGRQICAKCSVSSASRET